MANVHSNQSSWGADGKTLPFSYLCAIFGQDDRILKQCPLDRNAVDVHVCVYMVKRQITRQQGSMVMVVNCISDSSFYTPNVSAARRHCLSSHREHTTTTNNNQWNVNWATVYKLHHCIPIRCLLLRRRCYCQI